jgi:hypothetical protein
MLNQLRFMGNLSGTVLVRKHPPTPHLGPRHEQSMNLWDVESLLYLAPLRGPSKLQPQFLFEQRNLGTNPSE